jgi:hypothetical protein
VSARALDWKDRAACAAWLSDLRERCIDVIAVAGDQTAPLAKRSLGRAAAAQLLDDATGSLNDLFAYAARGLMAGDGDPGDHERH